MRWKTAIIAILAAGLLLGGASVLAQPPAENAQTRQPPEADLRVEFGGPGGRTGPNQVLKRFVCPDPRCRYSTNIWGPVGVG
ncbi:MAG: hypothetical protein ACE5O2_03165, partial [Armatimonadota bacterium]